MATEKLWSVEIRSLPEYTQYIDHMPGIFESRMAVEKELLPSESSALLVPGYCGICQKETRFLVDYSHTSFRVDGALWPNFRERMECEHCRLNTRLRASLQFLVDRAGIGSRASIYATEQVTSLFHAIKQRFPNAVGSEYLSDGTKPGKLNAQGVRHEDGTALTFRPDSFDYVLSFEVIEHIFEYRAALRELFRCLKPGGTLFLTAPFAQFSESHIERARIVNGEIEHMMEPEYHGDPLSEKGILCFRHYGWQLLDDLKQAGFSDAAISYYWSRRLGYIGAAPSIIIATKANQTERAKQRRWFS